MKSRVTGPLEIWCFAEKERCIVDSKLAYISSISIHKERNSSDKLRFYCVIRTSIVRVRGYFGPRKFKIISKIEDHGDLEQ
jgi:hypothetical protein